MKRHTGYVGRQSKYITPSYASLTLVSQRFQDLAVESAGNNSHEHYARKLWNSYSKCKWHKKHTFESPGEESVLAGVRGVDGSIVF